MLFELSYVSCPSCQKWFEVTDIMSYTVHNKCEAWSDGKSEQPLLVPFEYPFMQCSECGTLFWKEDCERVKDFQITEYHNHEIKDARLWLKIKQLLAQKNEQSNRVLSDLDAPFKEDQNEGVEEPLELLNSLISVDLNAERSEYVRQLIRQLINNLIRFSGTVHFWQKGAREESLRRKKSREKFQLFSTLRIENLNALVTLLKESLEEAEEPFERLELLIDLLEIERELGHFERAKVYLSELKQLDPEVHYNSEAVRSIISKSSKLIAKASSALFVV